jgi:hypothetical protein
VAGATAVRIRTPGKLVYDEAAGRRFVGEQFGPGPDLALVEIADPSVKPSTDAP